jgi:hypothetical protein
MHFGNRGPHFELMGQTLGGIFAFLLRQESQTPIERARSVGVCAIRILHQWRITAVTKAICEEPAWLTPLRVTVSRWSEHKDARLGAANSRRCHG